MPSESPSSWKDKFIMMRKAIQWMVVLALFWPMLFGVYYGLVQLYRSMDQCRFPEVSQPVIQALEALPDSPTEKEKGVVLLSAIHAQLDRELESTFGWSGNDLLFMPSAYFDNRNNRQLGVLFATRMLTTLYSTRMAKLGAVDTENELLQECRETRLVYGADIWGFFRSSAEEEYRTAVELMNRYKDDLMAGKAQYNVRTDDIYEALTFIIGEELLGASMGRLVQTNDDVPFSELDDRIYYAQGVILVVRDFLYALTALYPEIMDKGGAENVEVAFREMDRICTFDPLIVLRGDRDSLLADHRGKMARYFITVQKRLEDLAKSINR